MNCLLLNKIEETESTTFQCECTIDKKFRLVFDGGQTGAYCVEYCQVCFDNDDKEFLILTEVIL